MSRWNYVLFLGGICLFYLSACQQKKEKIRLVLEEGTAIQPIAELDLASLAELSMDSVTIAYDNHFQSEQTFLGTDFIPLLDKEGWRDYIAQPDAAQYKIVFEAVDGYRQQMPLALLYEQHPVLTDQLPTIERWSADIRESVLPYYLTWQGVSSGNGLPYPWGVTRIFLVQEPVAFPLSNLPHISGKDRYETGYQLFNKKCRGCHSINREGGQLGPDLNYPRSVTEYRSKAFLQDFINNPQAYRYNSKMVATALDDQEFEALYGYLKGMSAYTIN
jgi:cytochrome c2